MLENLLLKIIVDYLLIEFISFLISSLISPKKKKKKKNLFVALVPNLKQSTDFILPSLCSV